MLQCSICGDTEQTRRIIKSNKHGVVCDKCYQRLRNNNKVYELPKYGEIKYNEEGNPICHICGRAYKKLLAHVWQIHQLNEKEYKKEFGLELYNGIMCKESQEIARENAYKNYDKSIQKNLILKGEKTRFKKGGQGRTKDKVSERTRKRLAENRLPKIYKKQKQET